MACDMQGLCNLIFMLSGWRVVTLKFCIRQSLTSTSFTCMKAVSCLWNLPTVANGLSAPAKIICWMPGGRHMEQASFRWIKKMSCNVVYSLTWRRGMSLCEVELPLAPGSIFGHMPFLTTLGTKMLKLVACYCLIHLFIWTSVKCIQRY